MNSPGEDRQKKVKVAVLGTGSIGERYLRTLEAMDGVVPIAVPKRPERIPELAKRGFTAMATLEEAVANGADLSVIATETGQHLQDSLEAIDLGLDLLIEKPLAINAEDGRRLTLRAEDAGRQIYVACVLRFSESLNTFRELLGKLGRLHSVRIECQSYLPDWQPNRPYKESFRSRPGEGGVLLDLIHEIDYAGWLYGWPDAIQAKVQNLGRLGIESDEAAHLFWETSEGCAVSVTIDFLSRPSKRQMSAFGESGTLVWDGIQGEVTIALNDMPSETISLPSTIETMFTDQVRGFITARSGAGVALPASAEDGVNALAVCDAARKASESKREQKVAYS